MPAHVYTSVSADEICDQLTESGDFADEFWNELAQRLDAGALMDTTLDVLDETDSGRAIVGMLAKLVEHATSRMNE